MGGKAAELTPAQSISGIWYTWFIKYIPHVNLQNLFFIVLQSSEYSSPIPMILAHLRTTEL